MKTIGKIIIAMFMLCAFFCEDAQAQDFYGKGNVLIAVDMEQYGENEDVLYATDTMGKLVWGEDAPDGTSSRPTFNNKPYAVPEELKLKEAPDYEPEVTYKVGDKFFLQYPVRNSDRVNFGIADREGFSDELFSENGEPLFIYQRDDSYYGDDKHRYLTMAEFYDDGYTKSSVAFVEIECVQTGEYYTLWQVTGNFVPPECEYDESRLPRAVSLTQEQKELFANICDKAVQQESPIFGDYRFSDCTGDRDGKVAYIAAGLGDSENGLFNTFLKILGMDCVLINSEAFPGGSHVEMYPEPIETIRDVLIHELNHYICSGYDDYYSANSGFLEYLAEYAVYNMVGEGGGLNGHCYHIYNVFSQMQTLPGFLWNQGNGFPIIKEMAYGLGPLFLRYIECKTTGKSDGRLWTQYFYSLTSDDEADSNEEQAEGLKLAYLNDFLTETTGETLEGWAAQFMAAVVIGEESGINSVGSNREVAHTSVNQKTFFRSPGEYGTNLGDPVEDEILLALLGKFAFPDRFQGGGTTYAYRNSESAKIAITDADDRWYFFAADIDFPDSGKIIDIADRSDLEKIGNDMAYPLYGKYRLVADIDLGGETNPWEPIGNGFRLFSGEFDGAGHTITGLYIDKPKNNYCGLFGIIEKGGVVKNLSVSGTINACQYLGGISALNQGSITNCHSSVVINGKNVCGGISGYLEAGEITDCTFDGTVCKDGYCGGIAGVVLEGEPRMAGCEVKTNGEKTDMCGVIYIRPDLINAPNNAYKCRFTKKGNAKVIGIKQIGEEETIPDSLCVGEEETRITTVGKRAFEDNEILTSITLGENIGYIGAYAFSGCRNLKEIHMTGNIRKIHKNAFKNISKHAVFVIDASEEDFLRIKELLVLSGAEGEFVRDSGR